MVKVSEEWRRLPVCEHYEVSSYGRIRSLDRWVNGKGGSLQMRRGVILKPTLHHKGYRVVHVAGRQYRVHQLVAMAFIGPCPDGMVVNHIDGNKENNTPSNLEYVTNSENVHHAYRTGLLSNKGATNGRYKFTDDQFQEMIRLRGQMPAGDIAARFGTTVGYLKRIWQGQTSRQREADTIRTVTPSAN